MINKKNLWFLTLFSLILVLSVYYITMPSELLLTNSSDYVNNVVEGENKSDSEDNSDSKTTVSVEESEIISALRVSSDEELQAELDELKTVMTDDKSTTEEKNNAFEKMKTLNNNKGEETKLEQKIETEFKLKSFVKIDGDKVKVVIDSKEHDTKLANDIMRSIQSNYENKMYITVQFKS